MPNFYVYINALIMLINVLVVLINAPVMHNFLPLIKIP